MKLYCWKNINVYPYAGGMVTVIADDEVMARRVASELLEQEMFYYKAAYDLSASPEVKDITPGTGFAYYWEE